MDRFQWLGIVVGALGVALSAASSAYLVLAPDAAGVVLRVGGIASVILLIVGGLLIAWPRKKTDRPHQPSPRIILKDVNRASVINTDHSGRGPMLSAERVSRINLQGNRSREP